MEFRVLGPLEAMVEGRPATLGGVKQRLVLALLLVDANRVVSVDGLIDRVWGEDPPEGAKNALQAHVSHLRKALGADRIEGRPGGYALRVDPDAVDATMFERLVDEARSLATDDPAGAIERLRSALGFWRGPAFADLADEPSLRGHAARLEDLRLWAIERTASLELRMGRHSAIVGELRSLVKQYPLRERLWADLMLALYRSGRQAEALEVFEDARRLLAEELGIDPSPELRHLHQRMLSQDVSLGSPEGSEAARERAFAPARLEPGSEIAGYRIEREAGRGGMAVVFLAEDLRLNRKVVLKVLAPQFAEDAKFRERFVRESKVAASIDHPNVVPVYEAGESDGLVFIAMRYVEGTDLRRVLEDGRIDPRRAASIVRQTAAALDAAHARGLVHRDVKPANILLGGAIGSEAGEHVYLSDFGLTKRATSESGISGTGQFIGTLSYAAPEQFDGRPLDARTDVYSLGCVLYECLVGHPPFPAPNQAGIMYGHLTRPLPSPTAEEPDLPPAIDRVVATAIAKSPSDRYASAGELAAAADDVLGGGLVTEAPRSRSRATTIAVTVAVVAIVVASVIALTITVGRHRGTQRVAGRSSSAPIVPALDSLVRLDPETGRISDSVPGLGIERLGSVRPRVAIGEGGVWVVDAEVVIHVDPSTAAIEARTRLVDAGSPGSVPALAADFRTVWVTSGVLADPAGFLTKGALQRIDPATSENLRLFRVPGLGGAGTGVATGGGSVWAVFARGTIVEIDPASLKVRRRFDLGGSLDGVAFDESDGVLWVEDRLDSVVRSIDAQTGRVSDPIRVPGDIDGIAAGDGRAWVLDASAGTATPIAAQTGAGQPIRVGPDATDIAVGPEAVWVTDGGGDLYRIDAVTDAVSRLRVGAPLAALAIDERDDAIWILVSRP